MLVSLQILSSRIVITSKVTIYIGLSSTIIIFYPSGYSHILIVYFREKKYIFVNFLMKFGTQTRISMNWEERNKITSNHDQDKVIYFKLLFFKKMKLAGLEQLENKNHEFDIYNLLILFRSWNLQLRTYKLTMTCAAQTGFRR